uniref:DUF7869 domain-containing protein n=1 Tax=Panagrolaimus superbus TaxID=310955 RepID=A0A914Y6Q6_9BILA
MHQFWILMILLLWIPEITKIYLCYPEVGHTHDDADRYFSCLALPLRRKPVYSPFHFQRFLGQHLRGVVTNTLTSPVYDFDAVLEKNVIRNENLKSNHFFELSTDANNDAVKVIHPAEVFQNIPDPDNINLTAFLNDPKVWKTWHRPTPNVELPNGAHL